MKTKYKAMVSLRTGTQVGGSHMQWVEIEAENLYDARCALGAQYGRIVQGPIAVYETPTNVYESW